MFKTKLYLLLLMLFLIKLLKVLCNDGDGEGHHQHTRDGAEGSNQLTQSLLLKHSYLNSKQLEKAKNDHVLYVLYIFCHYS